MNILVGISWPFANGRLHIGHIASSLSGDVIARYYRLKGDNVILVSGSDCHGTPIDVRALKENKTQQEIVDYYDSKFRDDFKRLGFSFDLFYRTDDIEHKNFVKEQFKKYYKNNYLYEKEEKQLYCEHCNLFLADRYIKGICPHCGNTIDGDECDKCNSIINVSDIKETRCAICGNKTSLKSTKNLYFALSKFTKELNVLVTTHESLWRNNAVLFTKRYLNEGIPDRVASRSLKWGIDIPIKGYEDKKIYGWFENVWGYVSACKKYCELNNLNYEDYWKENKNNKIYLIHAKDNIPFHTIIFPALLLGTHENYKLPDYIISDEFLTVDGSKMSKSKGNYIAAYELLDKYDSDIIRYYFILNDPSKKDLNFTFESFNQAQSELIGKWGNFVNRNLAFIKKSFNGKLETSKIDENIKNELIKAYIEVGRYIESGNTKEALDYIVGCVNIANKYFDSLKPWILYKEDINKCNEVLFNCCNIILNINTLLKPFIPNSCEKVNNFINIDNQKWEYKELELLELLELNEFIEPLYKR